MFRTTKSETVYRGILFDVLREEVEGRGSRFVRELVVHPGAVAVVPVLDDGRLVLVKQYRHAAGEWLVEVPAGTIEDESPEECARRELEEEAGYRADELKKLAEFYLAPGYSTELLHVFTAWKLKRTSSRMVEDEQISVFEVGLAEVFEMVLSGRIRDAKTIASLLLFKQVYGTG
uniref:NUDIX hydrolase n=1 Tax=Caldiarchaeum subterraneum TaxID=311458 RepID=A0A7J3VTS3_CALS0